MRDISLMRQVVVILLLIGALSPSTMYAGLPLISEVEKHVLLKNCQGLQVTLNSLPVSDFQDLKAALQASIDVARKEPATSTKLMQELLDPFCLIEIRVNPESRVKAIQGDALVDLKECVPTVRLVKVFNEARVTHSLTVRIAEGSGPGKTKSEWLKIEIRTIAASRKTLSGNKLEYAMLILTPHSVGKREATLEFNVGQGTQDLGFRAEVPILFAIKKRQ